jgi:uncharacterized phage infection (PIP) family protein YhgE
MSDPINGVLQSIATKMLDLKQNQSNDSTELSEKNARIIDQLRAIVNKLGSIADTTARLKKIADSVTTLQTERDTLKTEVETLKTALRSAETDRDTARNEREEKAQRIEDLEGYIKDIDAQLQVELSNWGDLAGKINENDINTEIANINQALDNIISATPPPQGPPQPPGLSRPPQPPGLSRPPQPPGLSRPPNGGSRKRRSRRRLKGGYVYKSSKELDKSSRIIFSTRKRAKRSKRS